MKYMYLYIYIIYFVYMIYYILCWNACLGSPRRIPIADSQHIFPSHIRTATEALIYGSDQPDEMAGDIQDSMRRCQRCLHAACETACDMCEAVFGKKEGRGR